MSDSTEMATVEQPPSDQEIQQIRQAGKAMTARKKEVNELFKTLEGMEWGSGNQVVKGSHFSKQTRYALAEFCHIVGANPMTQVDILGGKPYLNASYWIERIVKDPLYIDFSQRDITKTSEERIRELAQKRWKTYEKLSEAGQDAEAAKQLARAVDLDEEAEDIAQARNHYGVPDNVTSAVETTIRRFMNSAPMEKIRDGEISKDEADEWIIEVKECNWAGGQQKDPVGNAEPEKTARTRSLRRCATRAFTAWMQPYEEKIEQAEKVLEAEYEIIQDDRAREAATLTSGNGQAVSTAEGEPVRGEVGSASDLPVDGEVANDDGEEAPQPSPAPQDSGGESSEPSEPQFDEDDARKRLFATLNAADIKGDARKEWAEENGLPRSTKDWGPDEYEKAQHILVDPVKEEVIGGCEILDIDLHDLSLEVIGQETPEYLKHWQALSEEITRRAEVGSEEEEEQQSLGEL